MRVARLLLIAVAALSCRAALGNDSTAELATGGLVLTKSADIEMRSEELYISSREIRVSYQFYNGSGKDVTTLVAFPMPDITIEHSDANISVPTEDPENLLGFSTTVNGAPVRARVEQKVLARGIDRTADLRRLGVPLAPHLSATNKALDRLPRTSWDELVRMGLAEIEEYDVGKGMQKHLSARWTLKTTYFWEQTFPARAEIAVEHRYQPSVGGSAQTSVGDPQAMREDWFAGYRRKYCMDRDFIASAERVRRATKTQFGAPFSEQRISYILSSGGNWSRPIGDFRLVVDKGDASSLVSFCGEGVRKIGPTLFEMRRTNFTPKSDLNVLILRRLATK
jgi:hypothetical protein